MPCIGPSSRMQQNEHLALGPSKSKAQASTKNKTLGDDVSSLCASLSPLLELMLAVFLHGQQNFQAKRWPYRTYSVSRLASAAIALIGLISSRGAVQLAGKRRARDTMEFSVF